MSKTHASPWLDREDFGDVTVVRVKAPNLMNDDIIRTVFGPIYSLVDEVARNKLVLNLAVVEFLPSLALGKLVMLNRKVQAGIGRLALCQLSSTVKEIVETTHLADVFNIYATESEALESFS
jgi:anti-anti-sigma factor